MSTILLWNQFMVGLPHSSLNVARRNRGGRLSDDQVQEIRGEFGHLLEGYVLWVILQWFRNRQVEPFANYEAMVGANWSERDLAIVHGKTLYLFEIKAHVYDLKLRETGSQEDLERFLGHPVMQVFSAARAFETGQVRRSDNKPIPKFDLIIPVAILYDPIPINLITAPTIERHLESRLGQPVFQGVGKIAPVQLVGLEDLELCEKNLRLDFRPEAILEKIAIRNRNAMLRYDPLSSMSRSEIKVPRRDERSPIEKLADASEKFLRDKAASALRIQRQTVSGDSSSSASA